MGIGPVPSTRKALQLAGMKLEQIDRVEVNEAFAAQYLAVERELGLNRDKTNVNGGAIALGHPLGASGTRLVITVLNELRRKACATDWPRLVSAAARASPSSLNLSRSNCDPATLAAFELSTRSVSRASRNGGAQESSCASPFKRQLCYGSPVTILPPKNCLQKHD